MKKIFIFIPFALTLFIGCMSFEFTDKYSTTDYDDTEYLESLINSEKSEVIIPVHKDGRPWIVNTLHLNNLKSKKIVFAHNCQIIAKKDAFYGLNDCLIEINNCNNLSIIGYGATLKMRKKDYQSAKYTKSNVRHTLNILACENLTIEGLKIESSGGDGIYIGYDQNKVCKNITIRNSIVQDYYRNGINVASVNGFLMENCSVFGSSKAYPKAGIAFYATPNSDGFKNCVITNSSLTYNKGSGIFLFLKDANTKNYMELTIKNTSSKHNHLGAITILEAKRGLKGKITIDNCDFTGMQFIRVPNSLLLINK